MNNNFINQVELSEEESNLNISQQSYNRELNEYVSFMPNQITDIQKCVSISEEINKKVKDCHSLMIYKDIDFFAQYIDDLYVLGTDIFNMIEIIKTYETEQAKELQESKEKIDKMEIYIAETSNQNKYHNINIQEVELDAMFEEMHELENERIGYAEGFDPKLLASINIPDIDDSLNLVFLWCTIALYGSYKEDYYWENFKEQVFKKNAVEDFVQRLLYKKASKMTRDQSFIAKEILNKQQEFLNKKYLKKKQKAQLEKLFEIIKNVNECWTISQEIRIKVLYFDQVQKEYLELEVMKAQNQSEKTIYSDKIKQYEQTKDSLLEGKQFLENQLTDMVVLQQSGEQYLLYLNETQKKFFPYYDKITIAQRVQEIEDFAFGNTPQANSQEDQKNHVHSLMNMRDSHILLMNNPDLNSLEGQTIPSYRSTHIIVSKIKPNHLEKKESRDLLSIGESEKKGGQQSSNQQHFDKFDAEGELDKSQNSDRDVDEDDEEVENKEKEKDNQCHIF